MEVSYSFFNTLGHFCDGGGHGAEAHGACPLPLSLLLRVLITCSADKKVDSTEIRIEEQICYASACVDSCTTLGKTTALDLAFLHTRAYLLLLFSIFQQPLPTKQPSLSSSGCYVRGLACARILFRSFVVVFCIVS